MQSNPEDEDPPYNAVACDVSIQTARPKAIEVVMNLEVGETEGNRKWAPRTSGDGTITHFSAVSALMVALDMIHIHKHTKSWALEIVLITDGESSFLQDEYEDTMTRLDDMGVKLTVV